jgi:hypothetical protein
VAQVLHEPVRWNYAGIHRDAVARNIALKEMSVFDPERYDAVMRASRTRLTGAPIRCITRMHVKSHKSYFFAGWDDISNGSGSKSRIIMAAYLPDGVSFVLSIGRYHHYIRDLKLSLKDLLQEARTVPIPSRQHRNSQLFPKCSA